MNRYRALSLCFEHDPFGKPVPTFPDHALALRNPRPQARSCAKQRIEAEWAAACRGEIKASETEFDGERSVIEQWEEALRKMLDEIGESHLAGQNESGEPGQQTQQQHSADKELDNARNAPERERRDILEDLHGREFEQFCHAKLKHEKAGNEPEQTQEVGLRIHPNPIKGHGFLRFSFRTSASPRNGDDITSRQFCRMRCSPVKQERPPAGDLFLKA
jgi:hypothetical protein